MSLQIQEGKSYRARNGEVFRDACRWAMIEYPWHLTGHFSGGKSFTAGGRYYVSDLIESDHDLIAEVEAEEHFVNGEHNLASAIADTSLTNVDPILPKTSAELDVSSTTASVGGAGGYEDDTATITFAPPERVLPALTRATDIAAKASDLVGGDRDRQHGAKRDNFERIAKAWNAWLAIRKEPAAPLDAHDVGVMMVFMKMARTQSGSLNIDDYVDAAGYAACAGEVAQQST